MSNKYLEKIASRLGSGIVKAFKDTPATNKLSLGLGMASVGLGAANFTASQNRVKQEEKKNNLEQKSLNALKGIHEAIVQGQD